MPPKLFTRILVIGDFQRFSDPLRSYLNDQSDLLVCGQLVQLNEAFPTIQETSPHVVLLDTELEGSASIDLGLAILERYPNLKVIFVALLYDLEHQHQARQAGFHGYLFRENSHEAILSGIQTVLAGERYFATSPYSPTPLSDDPVANELARWQSLNDRELKVIEFIMDGLDNYQIGVNLYVSNQLIRVYRNYIYYKLGVTNDIDLIHIAFRQGL